MKNLTLKTPRGSYTVYVGNVLFLSDVIKKELFSNRKVFVVFDENVPTEFVYNIKNALKRANSDVFLHNFSSGEENKNLESKLDDYFVDNECDDADFFHIDYKAKIEFIYNLLKKAGVNVANSQAVAHLCVLLTGYKTPRTIYNFVLEIINGNTKSNKSYWHDIDRLNAALIEGLSSKELIIKKRDNNGNVDSEPDKSIYQDDVNKMNFRKR